MDIHMFNRTSEVLAIGWNDNALVPILTNHGIVEPKSTTRRYNRSTETHVNIDVPNDIAQYNKYMGEMDLHNNALANYRIPVRSKKWWRPLFINLLGNILIATKDGEKPMLQLQFRAPVVTWTAF